MGMGYSTTNADWTGKPFSISLTSERETADLKDWSLDEVCGSVGLSGSGNFCAIYYAVLIRRLSEDSSDSVTVGSSDMV